MINCLYIFIAVVDIEMSTSSDEAADMLDKLEGTATFQGAEVDWYIKADDIVLKKGAAMNPQPPKKDTSSVK